MFHNGSCRAASSYCTTSQGRQPVKQCNYRHELLLLKINTNILITIYMIIIAHHKIQIIQLHELAMKLLPVSDMTTVMYIHCISHFYRTDICVPCSHASC